LTTFKEVLSTRPDCHPIKNLAWSLVHFPSGPLPVLHSLLLLVIRKQQNLSQKAPAAVAPLLLLVSQ